MINLKKKSTRFGYYTISCCLAMMNSVDKPRVNELKKKAPKLVQTKACNQIQESTTNEDTDIMANEMDAMAAIAQFKGPNVPEGQTPEVGTTETRSRTIVGPVTFKLENLRVRGLGNKPADPSNSPFIIAEDEEYEVAVDVLFNKTPLTELLMCLGTRIIIDFGLEGYGRNSPEVDVQATRVTVKDQYSYSLIHKGVARRDGLKPGLYEIGAVATVGPVENKCTTKIWGHGYIKEVLMEVYASGQE